MATEKEKALVLEVVGLAIEVNALGKVDAHVEYNGDFLHLYIVPRPYKSGNDWLYYAKDQAYFSDDVFSESGFVNIANEFITELKKYHPSFDADGVKL